MTRRVAAAILDGGLARRMDGTRKSSLRVGGARIIDRQLAVLRPLCDPVFVVARDAAPYADLDIEVVADTFDEPSALAGIITAIARSPAGRTLVMAGDMPFVDARLVRLLMSVHDADLVIPRTTGGLEPLCAIYGKACLEPIRARYEAGERRAAILPDGVRVREIGPEQLAAIDPQGLLFVNVNTPQEHARARSLVELSLQQSGDRITEERQHS